MERESEIVAQSGRVGAVTISTNMAGRGTDILLGGNPEFMARLKMRSVQSPCVVPCSPQNRSPEFPRPDFPNPSVLLLGSWC